MKNTIDYHDFLIERLKDINRSIGYLNECLDDEDPRLFLSALLNVYEAQSSLYFEKKKKAKTEAASTVSKRVTRKRATAKVIIPPRHDQSEKSLPRCAKKNS